MNAHSVMSEVGDRSVSSLPALLKDRHAWLSQLAFRGPLILYRTGLGGLLGHQFLVLTHVGRRPGQIHETVLKVLHYGVPAGICPPLAQPLEKLGITGPDGHQPGPRAADQQQHAPQEMANTTV